jgi:hypothetical protein
MLELAGISFETAVDGGATIDIRIWISSGFGRV